MRVKSASSQPLAALRWAEAGFAALLLWSCFRPWLSVMGSPVAASEIRDQLEGPHRLISAFTRGSRISFDYSIALWLKVLPFAAAAVLLLALSRRVPRPWIPAGVGLACGAGAVTAFFYLSSEAESWPFVHLAYGARVAAFAGAVLAAISLLRLVSARR